MTKTIKRPIGLTTILKEIPVIELSTPSQLANIIETNVGKFVFLLSRGLDPTSFKPNIVWAIIPPSNQLFGLGALANPNSNDNVYKAMNAVEYYQIPLDIAITKSDGDIISKPNDVFCVRGTDYLIRHGELITKM